jgi:hypothetical protein
MPDYQDVLDTVFNSYVDWFDEAQDVRSAYGRWRSAGPGDTARAFVEYTTALEREELAAYIYACDVANASQYVTSNLHPAIASREAAAS